MRFPLVLPLAAALAFLMLAAATIASAAGAARHGQFTGAGGHWASGAVTLEEVDGQLRLTFADDFKLQDAPDARVAFGRDGQYVAATMVARLARFRGGQAYLVPSSIDAGAYDEVWVWCEKFGVPLAVAKLRS